MMRIIRLGNPSPKDYRNHPRPPGGLSAEQLRFFAESICKIDVSRIPKAGDNIGTEDKPQEATEAHEVAFLQQAIETPYEVPWSGGPSDTQINVSPDSSFEEALSEIRRAWCGGGHGALPCAAEPPSWISGNDPTLVEVVRQMLKGKGELPCEIRTFNQEVDGKPPPGRDVIEDTSTEDDQP